MSSVKTIFITGCTGLVGHGICAYLLSQGYTVIGTARTPLHSLHPHFRIHELDLKSEVSIGHLRAVIPEVDVLIHNAAIIPAGERLYTEEQGLEFFAVNFLATYRIMKMFSAYQNKKLIYISGARLAKTVAGDVAEDMPFATDDEYSTSKLCAEILCRQFANQGLLRPAVLRISAPYGYILDGDAVIPRFIRQARNGENIELLGTGSRAQAFTFVEDIGRACELVWQKDAQGVFTTTGGAPVTMKELADAVVRAFPNTPSKVVLSGASDPEEGKRADYSIEKARRVLGYEPKYDIRAGLGKIAESMSGPSHADIFELL